MVEGIERDVKALENTELAGLSSQQYLIYNPDQA